MKMLKCDKCGREDKMPQIPRDLGGRFFHVLGLERYNPGAIDFEPVDLCSACRTKLDWEATTFMEEK